MNKNDYFEYETYQWDKFCFKLKIFLITILLLITVILAIFLIITKLQELNIWYSIFVCLLTMCLSYILYEDIKYYRIIEKQKYRKLILDNQNKLIKLIDKSDNILRFEFNYVKQVQIKKYELRGRIANIGVLGHITFFIGNEIYTIIISDIDHFIQNSIFQNVISIKGL